MPTFHAPVTDMAFVLDEIAGLGAIAQLPGYEEATPDLVSAVLEEAARFGGEVLAPLNPIGDREGCRMENGAVKTAPGFAAAYGQFVEAGWNALPFDPEFGGQGLPWVVGTAVQEIWHAANMSFGLVPMLTQGSVEALSIHGSDEQKALYLAKLISGEWTGAMNLTEPQAGSDVGALRTKAVRDGDVWRISGQKIFITAGDHDLAENIIHLVLARTPGAPAGPKGISLFVVPKFLVNADGSLGERNDVACIKLEEKLGIHGSPTCVMAFGETTGAIGTLVGEENKGLAVMFTMMNNARLAVGLEGVAQAERAYQKARAYAGERVQGYVGRDGPVTIIHHADVRRNLMTAKALTETTRALAYFVASRIDIAHRHPDAQARAEAHSLVELLTPVVKGWGTDCGIRVADIAVQVFGGMGYVEETGVAQHLRDARITAIYEGTNGIQALDLINRKLLRDDGQAFATLIETIRAVDGELADLPDSAFATIRRRLAEAAFAAATAAQRILAGHTADPFAAGAAAQPFLELVGVTAGGWLMARSALAAQRHLAAGTGNPRFLAAKITTAAFYAETFLTKAAGLLAQVEAGSTEVMALAEDQF